MPHIIEVDPESMLKDFDKPYKYILYGKDPKSEWWYFETKAEAEKAKKKLEVQI